MTSEPESAAITIRSWVDRLRAAGLSFFVVFGGMWLLIDALDRPGWAKRALVPAVAAYLAAAWLVVTWRICRMRARFGDQGVMIGAFFRTSRLSWPEVSEFTDGVAHVGEESLWALKIVLRDGRTVTAGATTRASRRKGKDPLGEVLATIEQVAARYEIPAQLTGHPARRQGGRGRFSDPLRRRRC
jgi:hypothetical protein